MEFASHRDLARALDAPVFFAHPGCPWERGTNEHHNGLLRRWLPKGTAITTVSGARLQQIAADLNDRPRKQLGWRTPAEKMAEQLAARRGRSARHHHAPAALTCTPASNNPPVPHSGALGTCVCRLGKLPAPFPVTAQRFNIHTLASVELY